MRRHLPAAGRWIAGSANGTEQVIFGSHAQHEAQRAVTIIRIKPVVTRPENKARGGLDGLVSSAADLEKDAVLTFEKYLAIVEPPRHVHDAIGTDEVVARGKRRAD